MDIPLVGKEPPLRLSLTELMGLYKVPALSIAVIDDYKIAWAKAYGTIGSICGDCHFSHREDTGKGFVIKP